MVAASCSAIAGYSVTAFSNHYTVTIYTNDSLATLIVGGTARSTGVGSGGGGGMGLRSLNHVGVGPGVRSQSVASSTTLTRAECTRT